MFRLYKHIIVLLSVTSLLACTSQVSLGVEVGYGPLDNDPVLPDAVWYGVGFVRAGIGWAANEETKIVPTASLGGGGGCCDGGLLEADLGVDFTHLPEDSAVGLRASVDMKTVAVIRSKEQADRTDFKEDLLMLVGGQLGAFFPITDDDSQPMSGKGGLDMTADRRTFGIMAGVGAGYGWAIFDGPVVWGQIAAELHTYED